MEDMQAGNESAPMIDEPITVQPGRESHSSQPIVLQPRSSNDSPDKPTSNDVWFWHYV